MFLTNCQKCATVTKHNYFTGECADCNNSVTGLDN